MAPANPEPPTAPKTAPSPSDRLDSWKEIARYLNRDVRTVQRWEETGGLPVYRRAPERLKGSPVYAYKSELDAWLRQGPSPPAEKESAGWSPRRIFWVAAAVFILAAGGAVVWRFARPKAPGAPLRVVRLTSYPGQARHPAFSPDGRQVAFSWSGEKQDNYDLYVKFLDSGEPLRLTTHPGVDGWPAWSPDGRTIAFWRWVRGTPDVDVLTVSALGGSERRILRFRIPLQPGANQPGLCWTPDGKWIVTVYTPNPDALAALALASVETLEIRPLTQPDMGAVSDCCPAITPDGRKLAFVRASAGRIPNVFVLPLGPGYRPAGEPRQLTREPNGARNPMWTGDGREVLYIAGEGAARELWRVPQNSSRPPARVESLGPTGMGYAISARGDRLAYSDRFRGPDIWRVDLPGGKRLERIVSSSASDSNPEISPDGARVAFISNRLGAGRVWVAGSDGANPIDIASIGGHWPAPARWSPDGNRIVFECRNDGNDDVCIVAADGGATRRLTRHPARDAFPSWSRDGKSIYFTSNRSGSFQLWKAPADGTDATAVQLTSGGGYSPVESPDGTAVFFVRDRAALNVWKVPVQGGPESQAGTFRFFGTSHNYVVHPEGIYYASSPDPEQWFELWLYRFASEKSESICRIEKRLAEGLSVSPDGRWLWFAAYEAGYRDLYMVENFR